MKRVMVMVALVALVACGDPSVTGVLSSGSQQTSAVTAAVSSRAPTTTTVPPTTTTTVPTTTTTTTTAPPTTTTVPPPTTTAPPSTTTVAAGQPLAADLLAFITVENEHPLGYVRGLFGYPADLDGDGCDTRSEVLQLESITPAQVDVMGCTVVQGDWISPYDGLASSNPGEFEIDHVVPLKEAWDSGAWAWNGLALVAYANDLSDQRALRAVSTATNRSKGDKDPSNWLPPSAADVCPYIADWVEIKAALGTVNGSERIRQDPQPPQRSLRRTAGRTARAAHGVDGIHPGTSARSTVQSTGCGRVFRELHGGPRRWRRTHPDRRTGVSEGT